MISWTFLKNFLSLTSHSIRKKRQRKKEILESSIQNLNQKINQHNILQKEKEQKIQRISRISGRPYQPFANQDRKNGEDYDNISDSKCGREKPEIK